MPGKISEQAKKRLENIKKTGGMPPKSTHEGRVRKDRMHTAEEMRKMGYAKTDRKSK